MEQADEQHCRICFSGPRGLADALIAPCGCRGTAANAHISCLHAWQVQKLQSLRDASSCEVCGQPYQVPHAAWEAWAAAEGGAEAVGQQRMLRLWQTARVWLVGAGRAALWALKATLAARHWWFWIGQAAFMCLEAEDVPQFPAGALPPPRQRMQPFVALAARGLGAALLLRRQLGGGGGAAAPVAFWGGDIFSDAAWTAVAYGGMEAALALRRLCAAPRWDALGAPPRQPLAAEGADALVRLATVVAAAVFARFHAFCYALLGPLAPEWIREVTQAGHQMLYLALANAGQELKLQVQTDTLLALFEARPAALAALHAALA